MFRKILPCEYMWPTSGRDDPVCYNTHMSQDAISEADILSEVVAPGEPGLPIASARSILDLRFNAAAISRMNELAEMNRQDTISDLQRAEMQKYTRVGNFLNLMQAKARLSLQQADSAS